MLQAWPKKKKKKIVIGSFTRQTEKKMAAEMSSLRLLLGQGSALCDDLWESLEEGLGALTGFRAAAIYQLV